jgi:hypothetical protein
MMGNFSFNLATFPSTSFTSLGFPSSGYDPTDILNRIAKGPEYVLPAKWASKMGKPNATQPVIFKDMVLLPTNEGILYAFDKASGALRWGWMPGESFLLNYLTSPTTEALLNGDVMRGQLTTTTLNGTDYILGTAKNGEIHYALSLNANGIPGRVWFDVRSGATSPNAEKPIIYSDKAIYVVGNKLVVRPISGGNPTMDTTPNVGGGTITSSPTLVRLGTNDTLLVGTSNGYVMNATLSSNGNVGSFDQVGYLGANEAVTYVVYTKTVDFEYVTAQSKTRVTTFKRRVTSTGTGPWSKIWSTTLNSATEWDFATGASKGATTVPALPSTGEITDRATSLGGYIGIPFTIPASGDSCDGTARLYLAPLDPTISYYAVYYLGQVFTDPYLSLGTGNAMSAQGMYLDGRMMMQGHSEKNATGAEGLDNPLEFVPIPPNKGPGRKSWREVLVN